jgi:hypothetical protein
VRGIEDLIDNMKKMDKDISVFVSTYSSQIGKNLLVFEKTTANIVDIPIPTEIKESVAGAVEWVGQLVEIQDLLRTKYTRNINDFKEFLIDMTNGWNSWVKIETREKPKQLQELYLSNIKWKKKIEELDVEYKSTNKDIENFNEWKSLLSNSSHLKKESLNCRNNFGKPEFDDQVNVIFGEISEFFKKKKIQGLYEREMFEERLDMIQKELREWITSSKNEFEQEKSFYIENLETLKIKNVKLWSKYDQYDHKASAADLVNEVRDKMVEFLDEQKGIYNELLSETKYSDLVLDINIDDIESRLGEVTELIDSSDSTILLDWGENTKPFVKLCELLESMQGVFADIDLLRKAKYEKKKPSKREKEILDLLEDRKDMPLKKVLTSLLKEEKIDVNAVANDVSELFRKNLILISLRKRG